MVANAIAFFLSVVCFSAGVFGFYRVATDAIPKEDEGTYIAVSFFFIVIAWVCARLGGI